MPKKTARSSKPAKKSVAKKAAPKKMSVMRTSAPAQKTFRAQQDDFHKDHPNANALILTFLVSFGLLAYLYLQLGW